MARFNTESDGNIASSGITVYIDKNTQLQAARGNTRGGQFFDPNKWPYSNRLGNGIFVYMGNSDSDYTLYGPTNYHFSSYKPTAYFRNTITDSSPPNPIAEGVEQTATQDITVNSLANTPTLRIVWRYLRPYQYITAEVTLTIPDNYPVSDTNQVRYFHALDTYLGGNDNGCGVKYTTSDNKMVVGTYPPQSNNSCPSSDSVPTTTDIVEAFRERDPPVVKNVTQTWHYCVRYFHDFWGDHGNKDAATTPCCIRRSRHLEDYLTTTVVDTGIAMEYAFTAPGTYNFSYDLVVGFQKVPTYDHLEIRHDGNATLCPEDITVLACLDSSMPCPDNKRLDSGDLRGSITVSPDTPTVSATPTTFQIGSSAKTATVNLQGTSPGGTYTLSAKNLSQAPANTNGVRCYNTATGKEDCQLTIANISCAGNFECLAKNAAYNNLKTTQNARNPLYTQLVGTSFGFDIVALDKNGNMATSYEGSTTVELFADSASPQPACSDYKNAVATLSNVRFKTTDNGRKALPDDAFSVSSAFRKLRCRVTDLNSKVAGCSSDDFSVRPAALTVTSSNANADRAGKDPTKSPVIKAGADFALTVNTDVAGYDGTPKAANALLEWTNAPADGRSSPGVGTLNGSFSAANAANGNDASGTFQYGEIGYFRFQPHGVYDDNFTSVDSSNGDCVIDSTTPDNSFSNTATNGKLGCYFGNAAATDHFGRFIPDHFSVKAGDATPGCSNKFTYFGQDGFTTPFTLTAQNSSNGTTQNYAGDFARFVLTQWENYGFSTQEPLPTDTSLAASATAPTGIWKQGIASVSAKHQMSRANSPTSATSVMITTQPKDADGVSMSAAVAVQNTATPLRFGRLRMSNVFGSANSALQVPVEAHYWSGKSWVINNDDSCTTLSKDAFALSGTIAGKTGVPSNAIEIKSGRAVLPLSAPSAAGNVDVAINLGNAGYDLSCLNSHGGSGARLLWLRSRNGNCAATYDRDPSARATFGIYPPESKQTIHIREVY